MTYTKTDGPLPILISSRIRLSEDQKKLIKDAYYSQRASRQVPDRTTATGISVATAGANSLDVELGMSGLVFSDLIASRDTIVISIILKIQDVLGLEVITQKQMLEACKNYIAYVFSK